MAGPLDAGLDTLAAGQVQRLDDGTEQMILATLPTPTGFSREIEVVRADSATLKAALACTRGDGWTVQAIIAEGLADAAAAEGFGTASGIEAESFAPILDPIGAGPILGPEEEAAAIALGWQRWDPVSLVWPPDVVGRLFLFMTVPCKVIPGQEVPCPGIDPWPARYPFTETKARRAADRRKRP